MTNALVVADDLTGAMDTGHGFAGRSRGVRIRLDPGGDVDRQATADVLAVDTDSRAATPNVAAAAVTRAVELHPASLVYKKVDSTLRGNVVAEVDAAVAATGADLAVVAPAFPAAGRTTVDGRHLVDETPLSDAGYGADESNLRAVFSPSRHRVSHVGTSVLNRGPGAVRDALTEARSRGDGQPVLAVCDASTADHLEAIADGVELLDADVLFVGSGGLAKHVTVPGEPRPTTADSAIRPSALGVVGSVNERTLAQLALVPDDVVVKLDPAAAVRDPVETGRDAVATLRDRIDRRGRAVVTAATSARDESRAETAAAEDGFDAGERITAALAAAASGTVAASAPGGLLLTGGAVAREVLTVLDASELALTGTAVGDGVPESVVTTGRAAGTRVVTKAGGFGDERTILNCLDALDRGN